MNLASKLPTFFVESSDPQTYSTVSQYCWSIHKVAVELSESIQPQYSTSDTVNTVSSDGQASKQALLVLSQTCPFEQVAVPHA